MGILRADRIAGLGGANAITGSVFFGNDASSGTAPDHIVTEPSSDFTMGTGDFTLEGWFFVSSVAPSWQSLIGDTLYGDTGGFTFYVNTNQLNFWKGGSSVVAGGTVKANTWHHLAYSRESGNNRVFVDGVLANANNDSTNYTDNELSIGANNVDKGGVIGAYGLNGFASNVRVTKGTALYTATFTPPTVLEKRSDTVLLCCQSCGNVQQEATGKKIIGKGNAAASHFTPNSPVGFSTTTDVGSQYGSTFDGFGSFATSTYMVPPGGNTRERNRGRALYAGGYKTPNTITAIDSLEIQSGGIVEQFGDLSTTQHANCSACSSSTRMVTNGGWTGSANNNTMEFVTIANSSNSTDFGDLAVGRRNNISASNQTRGLVYGGNGSPANTAQVDFFTIATAGNAADFGDASSATALQPGSGSSTTRALFAGGYTPSASRVIDYFTIASAGNYSDFGNLVSARKNIGGLSSSTRTLFGGGGYPSAVNSIDYVTTATTGNAQDFGDLTLARGTFSGTSNQTRGIFMGGTTNPARQNTIDFVIIAVTSDAIDFGDLRTERQNGGVASDSHGGL